MAVRDTAWLTLEACREYIRGTCKRPDSECKFAHPAKTVTVENGKVIACFDSLKGRCTRENCKYLHPPPHLKTQLEINGRNNLAAQKLMQSIQTQQHQLVQMQAMATTSHMPLQQMMPAQSVTPSTQALASEVSGSIPSSVYNHISQYTPYIYNAGTHPQMVYAPPLHNHMSNMGSTQVPTSYPYNQFVTSQIMSTPTQPGYAEVQMPQSHPHILHHSPYPFAFSPKPKNDRLELPTTAETNRLKRTSEYSEELLLGLPPIKKGPGMNTQMLPANLMYHHPQFAAAVMGSQPFVQTLSMVPHQGALPYLTQHLVQAQQKSEHYDHAGLSDTMPVCRDFKSGHCKRPNCKYAHVSEGLHKTTTGTGRAVEINWNNTANTEQITHEHSCLT